jgi:hypothetical protein
VTVDADTIQRRRWAILGVPRNQVRSTLTSVVEQAQSSFGRQRGGLTVLVRGGRAGSRT